MSEATGEPVTTYNLDGRREERLLARLDFRPGQLTVHNREDKYVDYLRVLAAHKIVFQLDTSFVPGQVAGDALICRLPCVGGNGTIERIAFPEICGHDRLIGQLLEDIAHLAAGSTRNTWRRSPPRKPVRRSGSHSPARRESWRNFFGARI